MTSEDYDHDPLREIYRAEDFESRVYAELEEENIAELKRVGREIFDRLRSIAADQFLKAKEAGPQLGDIVPHIEAEGPPPLTRPLVLSPELSPAVALRAMQDADTTIALVPDETGARYINRETLKPIAQQLGEAYRQAVIQALVAQTGLSPAWEPLVSLSKMAWNMGEDAWLGLLVQYKCVTTDWHRYSGEPGEEWCAWGRDHPGHRKSRVAVV